ncbi:MAG: type II toxin-antitoxin system HicA family toxin [Patescibacteria group bacterium]
MRGGNDNEALKNFYYLLYHDLSKLARERGFVFWCAGKGSHEVWVRQSDNRRTVIPNHGSTPLKRKTVKSVLDDLEIDLQTFMD